MNFRKLAGLVFLTALLTSRNILFDMKDAALFVECKKNNCFDVNMKGSVVDVSTNTILQNVPVTLTWESPSSLLSSNNIIDVQYCATSGVYNFMSSIDTCYFNSGYHLNISIPTVNNYIVYPKTSTYAVYSADSARNIQNLNYELYPKTQLVIQLDRQKTDALESLTVSHFFRKNMGYADKTITKTGTTYDSALSTSLSVETAAGVKTYISWTKKLSNGSKTIKTDSIICKKNTVNTFKITY